MAKRQPPHTHKPAPVASKAVKPNSGELTETESVRPRLTARAARVIRETEARRRVEENITRPLLHLWEEWDRAWPNLLGELIDGESDGYRAAGVALAEVGRLVAQVAEFRCRDFSDLLVGDVPNLLGNGPSPPVPADVLGRLQMMASSKQFHTHAPTLAAELLVSAATGCSPAELARELADAASDAQSRGSFGWFFFIRDRLLPLPGPASVGDTSTRLEARSTAASRDLHDTELAKGILPGRDGGHIDFPDDPQDDLSTDGHDGEADPTPRPEEIPLEPWAVGTFAANIGKLVGSLQAWHVNPFRPPITTHAKGDDSAIAKVNRQTFRDEAQPFIGRAEPVPSDANGGEAEQQSDDRDKMLWLLGEVARQAAAAPQGTVWDYLRGRIGELLETPSRTTATPPTDTAPLEFLVRQGRVVVVPREVGQPLLRGLEDVAARLLVPVADSAVAGNTEKGKNPTGVKKRMGRPPLTPAEIQASVKLFQGWKEANAFRRITKEKYVRERWPNEVEAKLLALDVGRKRAVDQRKKPGKKSSG
jgi:hypothetical protein